MVAASKIKIEMGAGPASLRWRKDPFLLIEGPAGTGKTRGILTLLLRDALHYSGMRILLARQTRESLTDSILTTLEDEVFPAFGMEVPGGAQRQNRSVYRLSNGSYFSLKGLDTPSRLFSTAWDRVYVAEAIESSHETIMKFARAMRGNHTPFNQVVLDTNPGAPGHWLNTIAQSAGDDLRHVETRAEYERVQRFNRTDPPAAKWKRILTNHKDNPGYFDQKTWLYTNAGRDYLERFLGSMTGHVRTRLRDGLWVAASGTVFPEFDTLKHVVHVPASWNPPADWPMVLGYDPGFDHPTCILWVAVAPDGTAFVIDEIYEGGRSVAQHCAEITRRNAGRTVRRYYGDPQEFGHKRAQGTSCADQAKQCGFAFFLWPGTAGANTDGSRGSQGKVEAVRKRLMESKLKVLSRCPHTIREFQSWSYKRTASGDLPPGDDAYEDRDNHAMDVIKGLQATGTLRYDMQRASVGRGE